MNPAEIIATKLLGFWECATPDWWRGELGHRWYRSLAGARCRVHADGYALPGSAYGVWPDLSDWNDIRRMEDALAEKGLYCSYLAKIAHIDPPEDLRVMIASLLSDVALDGVADDEARLEKAFVAAAAIAKCATADQCVAAALKVIEEAGL
jgi:hypothetical protein